MRSYAGPAFGEVFRELCRKCADETDPKKIVLPKPLLRFLSLQEEIRRREELKKDSSGKKRAES